MKVPRETRRPRRGGGPRTGRTRHYAARVIAPSWRPPGFARTGDDVVLADVRFYLDGRLDREPPTTPAICPAPSSSTSTRWLVRPPAIRSAAAIRCPTRERVRAKAWARMGIGDENDRRRLRRRRRRDRRAPGVDAPGSRPSGSPVGRRHRGLGRPVGDGRARRDAPRRSRPRPWPAEASRRPTRLRILPTSSSTPASASASSAPPTPIDPRSGHIPGARSAPDAASTSTDDRRLRPPRSSRERFATAGIDGTAPVVSYCGSGVTACHNLAHAGAHRPRDRPPLPRLVVAMERATAHARSPRARSNGPGVSHETPRAFHVKRRREGVRRTPGGPVNPTRGRSARVLTRRQSGRSGLSAAFGAAALRTPATPTARRRGACATT